MDQPHDGGDSGEWVPRRGDYVAPQWFQTGPDSGVTQPGQGEVDPKAQAHSLSWKRTVGLLALVLLIIWLPVEFGIAYYSHDDPLGRTDMTLGFVWAVVIEALAVWGLVRLLTRR